MPDDELVVAPDLLFEVYLKMAKFFGIDGSGVCERSSSVHFGVWDSMTVSELVLDKSFSIDFGALASIKIHHFHCSCFPGFFKSAQQFFYNSHCKAFHHSVQASPPYVSCIFHKFQVLSQDPFPHQTPTKTKWLPPISTSFTQTFPFSSFISASTY